MNPIVLRLLRFGSYGLWFITLFLLLCWLLFPWGRLADRMVVSAADMGLALNLDTLRISPFGFKAKGLGIGPLSKDGSAGEWLAVDQLRFSLPETGLLGGALAGRAAINSTSGKLARTVLTATEKLELEARLYGGDMKASLSSDEDAARLAVNASGLQLAQYQLDMGSFQATPSSGTLRNKSKVTWHWEDAKKSSGNIDLVIDGLILSGLKVMGFGLPETAFDRSEVHVKISRGRAEVRDTALEGDTLKAAVEGYVHLHTEPMRSRLALRLRFKVRDDLDGLLKVAFGSKPKHKDGDGWYHYQLNGTAGKPRLRESRAAARRAQSKGSRTVSDKKGGGKDKGKGSRTTRPVEPDEDGIEPEQISDERREELEEERARLREERAQRREERRQKREDLIKKRNQRQKTLQSDPALEVVESAEDEESADEDEEAQEDASGPEESETEESEAEESEAEEDEEDDEQQQESEPTDETDESDEEDDEE